jgi:hypothetical protein
MAGRHGGGAGTGRFYERVDVDVDWFTGVETRMMACAPVKAGGRLTVVFTP